MSEEAATLNPSVVVLKSGEKLITILQEVYEGEGCLLYTSPSPRDVEESRMPSSA